MEMVNTCLAYSLWNLRCNTRNHYKKIEKTFGKIQARKMVRNGLSDRKLS